MTILVLLLKIILYGFLIVCLLVMALIGILLLAPIRYQIYFEKYEEMAYEIHFSFLKGIKGHFLLADGKKESKIKSFWKVIYEEKAEQDEANIQKVSLDKADEEANKSKNVIKSKSIKNTKNPALSKNMPLDEKDTPSKVMRNKKGFNGSLLWQHATYDFMKETLTLIIKIIRIVAPQSFSFELVIGKDDPGDTGECIAKLTMLYPLYYPYGNIKGNYERACVEGGFLAEGKIHLIAIVKCVIAFLLNACVRKMINQLFIRKERENNHGK